MIRIIVIIILSLMLIWQGSRATYEGQTAEQWFDDYTAFRNCTLLAGSTDEVWECQ